MRIVFREKSEARSQALFTRGVRILTWHPVSLSNVCPLVSSSLSDGRRIIYWDLDDAKQIFWSGDEMVVSLSGPSQNSIRATFAVSSSNWTSGRILLQHVFKSLGCTGQDDI